MPRRSLRWPHPAPRSLLRIARHTCAPGALLVLVLSLVGGCDPGQLSAGRDGASPPLDASQGEHTSPPGDSGSPEGGPADGGSPGPEAGADAPRPVLDAAGADAMTPDSAAPPDAAPPGPDAAPPVDAASPADAGTGPDSAPCVDNCPAPNGGVTWQCKKRFMYGVNWAWLSFGGDFGGVSSWSVKGVSQDSAAYSAGMSQIQAAGVSVIRWWMFPRFFTSSITFGSDDAPSGIGGTLVADIHKALELAHQHDVYIMLTLFSFDSFEPTKTEAGIYTPGLQPMVVDATRRAKLLKNLVAPVARAVESSPYKERMIAWDMINEPEWAMTGANLYGSEPFSPQGGLQAVTHAQMETFLKETAATLRANSSALITIGGAAIKWARAWTGVNVDFYQLHYYDWVYEWYPYASVTLASVGLTGKPVVMGEFPIQGLSAIASKGLPAVSATQLSADLWAQGYAGALSWAYNDSSFPWDPAKVQGFASKHPCETAY